MTDKTLDIYIVGVGGQGVLTVGSLIAEAAGRSEVPVTYYPTKGMSQRGGHVHAQLRLGRNIGPSLPPKSADVVVSMELSESLKALPYLKDGGKVVIYGYVWEPTMVMLGKAKYPDKQTEINEAEESGASDVFYFSPSDIPLREGIVVSENIFLLGVLMGTSLERVIEADTVRDIITKRWPKSTSDNIVAFDAGLHVIKTE